MDNLEKYIQENRAAFDSAGPDPKVWKEIDRQLSGKQPAQRVIWMRRLRIAAAVVLLLTAGGTIGAYLANPSGSGKDLGDISPEYAELERYFNRQIDEKISLLASYHSDDSLQDDFRDLDILYEQLKKELKEVPPKAEEQVIHAMIENYQSKIDILEQVLEKIQGANQENFKTTRNEIGI